MKDDTIKVRWNNFPDVYSSLRSPLRPCKDDVAIIRDAIARQDGNVLLLGTTPELSVLGIQLTAVDGSIRMVQEIWPGDTAQRRAICADWFSMPIASASVDAVIGDGSLNSVASEIPVMLQEVERVLNPHGVSVFRTFCSPEQPESLNDIRRDVENGWSGNFHALKWRIAMSIAAEAAEWTVGVVHIRQAFDDTFPDRRSLCDTTGWSETDVATIDYYESATHSMSFPTVSRFREMAAQTFPSVQFIPTTGYPLAERCPTIIMRKRAVSQS